MYMICLGFLNHILYVLEKPSTLLAAGFTYQMEELAKVSFLISKDVLLWVYGSHSCHFS